MFSHGCLTLVTFVHQRQLFFPYQRQLPHSLLTTLSRDSGELAGGGGRSPEPDDGSPESIAAERGRLARSGPEDAITPGISCFLDAFTSGRLSGKVAPPLSHYVTNSDVLITALPSARGLQPHADRRKRKSASSLIGYKQIVVQKGISLLSASPCIDQIAW